MICVLFKWSIFLDLSQGRPWLSSDVKKLQTLSLEAMIGPDAGDLIHDTAGLNLFSTILQSQMFKATGFIMWSYWMQYIFSTFKFQLS